MITPRAARLRLLVPALTAGALLLTGCTGHTDPDAVDPALQAADGAPATAAPAQAATSAAAQAAAGKPAGADDPALKSFYAQQITWAACPDPQNENLDTTGLECGKLHVPLDYANPGTAALDIALVRLPAAKPDQKVGSLVVNPGGPGGSGLEFVEGSRKDFAGALHNRFDVVGFDPRGTGQSSPVSCLTDAQRDALDQIDSPDDAKARRAQSDQRNQEYAAACQANSGKLLPFVGTRNTARDVDVLRQALGERKLNYLGISYGTYLGALYAEEFPKNTGHLVLDGAVDPAADPLDESIGQLAGFEKSLRAFAADCVRNHAADCPLGTDPDTAAQKASDYLDTLHDHPLATADGRKVNRDLAQLGTIAFLYGDEKTTWPMLRLAFVAAMKAKKGDVFLAGADTYNGRDEKGHYSPQEDAHTAISCADGAAPAPSPERIQQVLAKLKEQAPLFSKDTAAEDFAVASCAAWPFRTTEAPHTVRAEGSAPILVVGTTGDPATPYAAAESLAKGFASATLLTREGEGHGAFGAGNACIDLALEVYLIDGTLPAAGTRCAK
ncbi:alpha/beta hydrolase [Kitasatospora sp. NPDC057223]|uniref:alpha/beta hydrolase n=1 Tax=Kitasatospora sp. NPDC057223 TaxID=3346055 RepID=UPI003642029B